MSAVATDDAYALLTLPGGTGRLCRCGDRLMPDEDVVAPPASEISPPPGGYPIVGGVVRMLGEVEAALQVELEAQDQALPSYLDERLVITRYEPTVARLVVEELLDDRSGRILDAGSGIGLVGRMWPDLDLVAVDASATLLAEARTGYSLRVECDVARLPFADGTFDAVLAINMLHHVVDPDRAVAELARVLRPGGALVAVDPRKVAPIELAKQLLRSHDTAYAPTHRAFSVDEYQDLFSTGALAVEELRPAGFAPLLVGGGLDAVGVSQRLPGTGGLLRGLQQVDELLSSVPGLDAIGLNLAVRARRR